MSPHAKPEQILASLKLAKVPIVAGPFTETWQSASGHDHVPKWLEEGKFGIFIHFGLYSIPAHGNEWYQKNMVGDAKLRAWHIDKYGPLDKFGYKDFIPLFTLPKFDPNQWAELFRASGAAWVMPTAEHLDGYSLWDSRVNRFNSVQTGPHRDIIGELAQAVRAQGMKFGVTNHCLEHYDFIPLDKLPANLPTDLQSPGYQDFYWVNHTDERLTRYLAEWVEKNVELIDQYQPDILWFDNGLNHRMFDALKLKVLTYYYNRAATWKKDVTVTGKGTCFIAGGLQDFETTTRCPKHVTDFPWLMHDMLATTWGYTDECQAVDARTVIDKLADVVSRNGSLAINVAPRGDGSIPEDQAKTLREVGAWLQVNGEAIYGAKPFRAVGDTGEDMPGVCLTRKGTDCYVIVKEWPPSGKLSLPKLTKFVKAASPPSVKRLGSANLVAVDLSGDEFSLRLESAEPSGGPAVFRIQGLSLTEN
jgi:alpha-L-fucosidase